MTLWFTRDDQRLNTGYVDRVIAMAQEVYAPVGVQCGQLITRQHRSFTVKWTRDMTGPVAKTTKSVNRCHCSSDAKMIQRVTDDLWLGVCGSHCETRVRA